MFRLRTPLSLVAVFLLIAVVAAVLVGGRLIQDWNAFHNPTPAGSNHLSSVAQLEAVPLHIPNVKSYLDCKSGPYNSVGSLGSGPVYGDGGGTSSSSWGVYYHNLAYTLTNISGPILIRARDLFTNERVVFVGQYAAGPVVGTDTVDGKAVLQHTELLLDPGSAIKNAGTHKFDWPFIAGVPTSSGSTGWQIDGAGFSEVFVAC